MGDREYTRLAAAVARLRKQLAGLEQEAISACEKLTDAEAELAHHAMSRGKKEGSDNPHSTPCRFVSACPRPRGYIPGACMLDVWKPEPG
eukprot:5266768-Prymnesium_polylepis.1